MEDAELDHRVAREVMGMTLCECDEDELRLNFLKAREERLKDPFAVHEDGGFFRFNSKNECNYCSKPVGRLFEYSRNIRQAFDVVDKIISYGWRIDLGNINKATTPYWMALFERDGIICSASEASPSRAICMAALKLARDQCLSKQS